MMYVKDDSECSILERAEKLLGYDFNWQIKDDEMTGIVNEDYFEIIDNLCTKIDELQEQIDDMEEDIRENYKPISKYEFYGVNEKEFY